MSKQSCELSAINTVFMAVILTSFLTFLIIAYSSIIFTGPNSQYAPFSYVLMFSGVIVANMVYSRYAKLPFMIAGPNSVVSIFFCFLMWPILANIHPEKSAIMTIIATFFLSNLLTASLFYIVGRYRLGQIIRFIPYTVIGGFLAGLSLILLKSGFNILTDLSIDNAVKDPHTLQAIACTLFTTACLLFIRYTVSNTNATSLFLLFSLLLTNILTVTVFKSLDLSHLYLALPGHGHGISLDIINVHALSGIDFLAILESLHFMIGLAIIAVFVHLLNNSSIELFSSCNDDLDQQIILTSKANFLSAIFASYITIPNVTVSFLSFSMKVGNKSVLFVTSILSIAVMIFLDTIIPLFPKFIIASVILMVGINLLKKWMIDTWETLNIYEYGSIVLMSILIIKFGLLYGMVAGLIINSIYFIVNSTHSKTMRYHFTEKNYQSNLIRPLDQVEYLECEGDRIHLYKLQGYLFFGSAKRLADRLLELFNECEKIDYVIVDFSLVTGVDVSGCYCFVRLEQEAKKNQIKIIYANVNAVLQKKLSLMGVNIYADNCSFSTIDESLEWCENQLLARSDRPFFDFMHVNALPNLISSKENYAVLQQFMVLKHVQKGEYLFHEGDTSTALYLVKSGLLSILKGKGDRLVQLNKGGAGTLVGELAFFTQTSRTADVLAVEDTHLYELSSAQYYLLQAEHPAIALDFMQNIIKVLALNLKKTSVKVMMLL